MRGGYIYFVQGVDGGPVKIGWSENPEKRLEQLQAASPDQLRILDYIIGDRHHERALHGRLSEYRLRGEWFDDCPPVREAIAEVMRGREISDLRDDLRERVVDEVVAYLIEALQAFKSREDVLS